MEYIESLLEINKRIKVPCQTDLEYKVTSNQSSWCAALFGLKYKELKESWYKNQDDFLNIYKNCLKEGTIMRKENGIYLCGENIDNSNLIKKLELNKNIHVKFTYIKNVYNCDEFTNSLSDDLKDEFYTRKYSLIDDFTILSSYKFILVSCHGHSLTLIPIGDYFLVLDSYVNIIGLMNKKNTYKYMGHLSNNNSLPDKYLYLTILCGS
jgi:hypothetical protein